MPTKLKRYYDSLDDVEETFRPLYVEKDGKFVRRDTTGDVEFEGTVAASKLDEFRTTNVKDRERFETELEKYKDVDVEKYRDLLTKEKDLEDHKLVKRGELDTVRRQAAEEAIKPLKSELEKKEQDAARLRSRLASSIIENKAVEAAIPLGLRKGAARDLISRAREIFQVNEEGEVVAFEKDGKTPKYHLGDAYSIEQFVKDLSNADDGKHLFEKSTGGGGEPGKGTSAGSLDGSINYWSPEHFNRSKQGEVILKDRALATRQAAKHGYTLPPLHSLATAQQA